MSSYAVIAVDLNVPTSAAGVVLIPAQQRIGELFILQVPPGASLELALGDNGDFFTIAAPFTMEPDGDLAEKGVRLRNLVAQGAGVGVQVVAVYGSARLSTAIL